MPSTSIANLPVILWTDEYKTETSISTLDSSDDEIEARAAWMEYPIDDDTDFDEIDMDSVITKSGIPNPFLEFC